MLQPVGGEDQTGLSDQATAAIGYFYTLLKVPITHSQSHLSLIYCLCLRSHVFCADSLPVKVT